MIPEKIGRYEIKSELGRGGMANVYRGYDPRFKREVAIKLLPHEFLRDPNFRARFEREAEVIAALEHPAIVPVHDYGEDAEAGQPYIVMRLMTGGSLAERLERGPLALTETARIFSRLAPALDRAHARGIIHRDLKPANILFDDDDNPYISDFGIAKLTEGGSTFTGSGVVGTPAYMSPEQARGEKHIDGRSDIYALGAIVFQMLTGKFPYEADTPMGIIVKHITDPVPHILDANAELPSGCEDLIQKAMAKKPADRFPKAVDMSGTLDSIATGTYTPAVVPPTLQVDRATVDAATRAVQQAQDAKKAEQERIARERAEAEAKAEQERIARERAEAERLAKERAERKEAERLARERVEREEAERMAKAAIRAEPQRATREKIDTGPTPQRQPTVRAATPTTIAAPRSIEHPVKTPAAKPRSAMGVVVGLIVVGFIVVAVATGAIIGLGTFSGAKPTATTAALVTQAKPPTQAPTSTRPPKPTEAPANVESSKVKGPLTIWYAYGPGSGEEQALKEIIARAQKTYPGAKIEAAQFDLGALFEKYQISVKAGEGPDLMVAPNDDLGAWARGGFVLDITGFLKGRLEGVNPVAVDGMMVNGRMFGVPESAKAVGLYYNRAFISEPPRNMDELFELVKSGRTLVVPLNAYHVYGFFGAFGGQLLDKDGRCIADQGGYVQAMQFLLELKAVGAIFEPDYGIAEADFRDGKVAMFINGPWALADYRHDLGDALGVAPIPGGPGGPARPLTDIDGFYVNPNSKNVESAVALALFLTTPDSMQAFTEIGGHIPIRPGFPVKDPLIVAFSEAATMGFPRPQSAEFGSYWGPFGEMVVDVMNGPVSPEEGVKRACDKMNAANGK